ncbi:hypothetical protein [Flexivirga alba]|uniref:Uncharacterized protein n=1 Tax=Flexivirga alba TaxID=702742 RepID=A0ABW2AF02_9MICO
MTRNLDLDEETPVELRRRRSVRVRIWAGLACYLLTSLALDQWGHSAGSWRVAWAALPLFFLAWVVGVVAMRMRQLDEYQIKLAFPGLAVGFAATVFAAFAVGTLDAAGLSVSGGWPVAIVGLLAWAVTTRLVKAPTA